MLTYSCNNHDCTNLHRFHGIQSDLQCYHIVNISTKQEKNQWTLIHLTKKIDYGRIFKLFLTQRQSVL